ncbi:MAG: MBL fold metallo-hydrolase [Puniceicoccales bacterium]|jgi:hypothetical protein|nr:MBL fold metallo-hydrolase [Puniceicoccales bacterium]
MAFYYIIWEVVICVLAAIWGIAAEPQLEVCFFSTGQGNCIALRSDVVSRNVGIESKLIFIDCGRGKKAESCEGFLRDWSKYPGKKLRNLFKGVSVCEILITHNHVDHDNLVGLVAEVGRLEGCSVLAPIRPMSLETFSGYPENPRDANKLSRAKELEKDWSTFQGALSRRIGDSLGPYVRVVPIRPKRWQKITPHEHEFNMMYLVEFAGRRILFTGDINPQLFMQIIKDPKYEREIGGVDFLIMPHHGSNRSGELMTKAAINAEMCIFCSDPKDIDNLPWKGIVGFRFKMGNGIITKGHRVSRKREDGVKEGRGENVEIQEETSPIFVTCDAAQGYYELVITANGTARLFDGPTARGSGNFCFQSL